MTIASLLEPVTGQPGPARFAHAGDWMQGRTLYGGASALVALHQATRPAFPRPAAAARGADPPSSPRSARKIFAHRGNRPAGDAMVTQLRSEILMRRRQGSRLRPSGCSERAREANALRRADRLADWPGESRRDNDPVPAGNGPSYNPRTTSSYAMVSPRAPTMARTVRRWARLTETHDLDPVSKLVLMGDVMPGPGAMRAMQRIGPISSINCLFNVLDPDTQSRNGGISPRTPANMPIWAISSERLRMLGRRWPDRCLTASSAWRCSARFRSRAPQTAVPPLQILEVRLAALHRRHHSFDLIGAAHDGVLFDAFFQKDGIGFRCSPIMPA